jgi:hypothetical protein
MPVAYSGHCFSSVADAAQFAHSFVGVGSGPLVLEGVAVSGTALVFTFRDFEGNGSVSNVVTSTVIPGSCSSEGPLLSAIGSGLTIEDAVLLSWAIIAVWIAGHVIALMRRAVQS